MLKFVAGLTDVVDYEGFIYSESKSNDPSVYYNIRKPSTELEKASIEWKIDTTIDAVKNSIILWEKIIMSPHLCMIGVTSESYELSPDFNQYYLYFSFINLLPISTSLIKEFSDSDYDRCNGDPEFGDLCINMYENVDDIDPYNTNIISAFHENNIKQLTHSLSKGSVLPKYFANFNLGNNGKKRSWIKNLDFVKFINDNKAEIESKGYDINSNRITNYGPIVIGKLISDPVKTYENLTKYPRICRTSFVQTED